MDSGSDRFDEAVTFLVNEDGEMVLDITQTLSGMEGQKEGSVVIITTGEAGTADQLEEFAGPVTSISLDEAFDCPFIFAKPDELLLENHSIFTAAESREQACISLAPSHGSGSQVDITQFRLVENFTPTGYSALDDITHSSSSLSLDPSCIVTGPSSHLPSNKGGTVSSETVKNLVHILPKPAMVCLALSSCEKGAQRESPPTKRPRDTRTQPNRSEYEVRVLPQSSIVSDLGKTAYVCELCASEPLPKFSSFEALSRHYYRVHRFHLLKQANASCRETNCGFKAWKVDVLRQHLVTVHGINMQWQTHEFASLQEFETWKADEEQRTMSKFVRVSGDRSVKSRAGTRSLVYTYYSCRHSGNPKIRQPSDEPRKSNKGRTSLKINAVCTASVSLVQNKELNRITCEYCPTHYGHDPGDPKQQHLSKQEKDWILQLLLRGWNSDEIVKTLASGAIAGTTDRMRRVVRQDVFNVCRAQGMHNFERRDKEDDRSVKLFVEELQAKSSVVVWNQEGRDVLLIVMNECQADFTRKYGDIVHVTDLPMVLDRHYRLIAFTCPSETNAYLIAYALTNRIGAEIMQTIVAALRTKVESFRPVFVLASNPQMLADSWISRTEDVTDPTFLVPPWKIENDWDGGLTKHVSDEGKRDSLRKCLFDILMTENDPNKLLSFLQLFTNMLAADDSLSDFSHFFAANYSVVAGHWPGFHRLRSCSALHELSGELELIVRRTRAVKRLDKCLYSLEFMANNQPFRPFTEFISTRHNDQIANLRQKIGAQLTALGATVNECNNLLSLQNISRMVAEAEAKADE